MYKYYLAAREVPREKCILKKKVGKCLRENIFLKIEKKNSKKNDVKKIILQGIVRAQFFLSPYE